MPRAAQAKPATKRPVSTKRKAPTGVASSVSSAAWLRKQYLLSLLFTVVISATSIGVGVSDAGVIDVSAVIAERNAKVANGEVPEGEDGSRIQNVPVQNTNPSVPNGGLRGAGDIVPTPKPQTSTSTATTTDDGTASSTEETIDEEAVTDESDEELEATTDTEVTEG